MQSSPVMTAQPSKVGMCPHGLPPAACPVCSGGGAMRGGNIKTEPKPVKQTNSGEWSYMKCYAVGLAMRAQEARAENAKNAFERQIEFGKLLSKNIQRTANRIFEAVRNFQNSMPQVFQKPIELFLNFMLKPALNILQKIPELIEKFALFQKDIISKLVQASDKLTAILGDIRNFINRKITEKIKKKIKRFFLLFTTDMEGENYNNDETIEVFKSREIKKYLIKIISDIKKKEENTNEHAKRTSKRY